MIYCIGMILSAGLSRWGKRNRNEWSSQSHVASNKIRTSYFQVQCPFLTWTILRKLKIPSPTWKQGYIFTFTYTATQYTQLHFFTCLQCSTFVLLLICSSGSNSPYFPCLEEFHMILVTQHFTPRPPSFSGLSHFLPSLSLRHFWSSQKNLLLALDTYMGMHVPP